MSFEITRLRDQRSNAMSLIADRALCLAADERTVVEERDARAAFVLCGPGGTIDGPTVTRLGLVLQEGRVVQLATTPAESGQESGDDAQKQRTPSEDKSRQPD